MVGVSVERLTFEWSIFFRYVYIRRVDTLAYLEYECLVATLSRSSVSL